MLRLARPLSGGRSRRFHSPKLNNVQARDALSGHAHTRRSFARRPEGLRRHLRPRGRWRDRPCLMSARSLIWEIERPPNERQWDFFVASARRHLSVAVELRTRSKRSGSKCMAIFSARQRAATNDQQQCATGQTSRGDGIIFYWSNVSEGAMSLTELPHLGCLDRQVPSAEHQPFQDGHVAGRQSVRGADDYPLLVPRCLSGRQCTWLGFSRGSRDAEAMTPRASAVSVGLYALPPGGEERGPGRGTYPCVGRIDRHRPPRRRKGSVS